MTTSTFGSSIKRREDPKLITGQGNYVDDIKLFGMLHAAIVRSPHAHARITNIDTSKAKSHPGVVAVFTGAELRQELGSLIVGWLLPDIKQTSRPPMAYDTARFVGEAVAIAIANDPATAADAAGMVDVTYEPMPAVVNAEETTKSGAPQLHEDVPNNIAWEWGVAGGDIEAAASQAEVTVRERIINQRLIPTAMEGRGVVTDYNSGTNHLTVWTSTQVPHFVRLILSIATGHPEHQLRIITPDVGGGFRQQDMSLRGRDNHGSRDQAPGKAHQVD